MWFRVCRGCLGGNVYHWFFVFVFRRESSGIDLIGQPGYPGIDDQQRVALQCSMGSKLDAISNAAGVVDVGVVT